MPPVLASRLIAAQALSHEILSPPTPYAGFPGPSTRPRRTEPPLAVRCPVQARHSARPFETKEP